MELDWNFPELKKLEQGALVCTCILDQLMKRIWKFQIGEFLDLLQEFDLNFDFGYLELD
jgi:hypothetical protein